MKINKRFVIITTLSFTVTIILCSIILLRSGSQPEIRLPVMEPTASYPDFSMVELINEADIIVDAYVTKIGETILQPTYVSYSGEVSADYDDVLYFPETPIYLEVSSYIKGESDKEIIYYQDGGKTSEYILSPSGYSMEHGTNVILFLDESYRGWGGQSEFLVADDNVILKMGMLDEDLSGLSISQIQANTLSTYINVCKKEDFVNWISTKIKSN